MKLRQNCFGEAKKAYQTMQLEQIYESVRLAYDQRDLCLPDREVIRKAFLDPLDVRFLTEVGVPRIEEFEISFNLVNQLPSLREYIGGSKPYLREWPSEVRCFNAKEDVLYGIDKSQEDAVVCIDLRGESPV